ncbi:DUF6950 family protein [Paucibacter sp. Y2R2-4]|uniref:DUF6950 family protein n=1 Tax=Paucibacter sp. Y2R2-4 TaxID=2893553 RepID=UPI0021E379A1|nr:hypothetical protein [Paucibacter sp. Y2R2-4]MCV2349330.1 hypothetical protein [Paucibacter sp. Y2R2-4]
MSTLPKRLPDWPHRLDALVRERLTEPFAWGRNDCCNWAADVVRALRGDDALQEFRDTPRRSAAAALRRIRQRGGIAAGMARAGLEPVLATLATRGDLVLLPQGRWPVLALCEGEFALAPGAAGLVLLPMNYEAEAWAV